MAKPFSAQLETWLKSDGPKTVGNLGAVFGEKSFAITILLLMFIPALPLPTGGITHIFELITMLLAVEMIIGRRIIWLPKRWQKLELGKRTLHKAIPFIGRRIRWFERYSRPRLGTLLNQSSFLRLAGVIIFVFTLGAFLAPPFSGLDTLPALGVVVVALSLILSDVMVLVFGIFIGLIGISLNLTVGTILVEAIKRAFP